MLEKLSLPVATAAQSSNNAIAAEAQRSAVPLRFIPFAVVIDAQTVEYTAKISGWPLNQDWDNNTRRIERIVRGPIAEFIHGSSESIIQNPFYEQAVNYCKISYPFEPIPWWKRNFQAENEWQPSG